MAPKKVTTTKNTDNPADETKQKKPFDKAKWREKKYSKKFKVDQWEERRRKAALHHYYKDLRKEDPTAQRPGSRKKKTNDSQTANVKPNAYQQAQQEFERKRAEKEKRQEEIEKQKAGRKAALDQYRVRRTERYKKLSKKTKTGQPVMKDRMEMLLEQIQKQTNYQC